MGRLRGSDGRSGILACSPDGVDLLARRKDHRQILGRSGRFTEGFVFTTVVGTPMDCGRVTREFQALLRRAGLPQMRF
jgi:hypothetical protein